VGTGGAGACSPADQFNACNGRVCGRDPVCGVLCGTCTGTSVCQDGQCFAGCIDTLNDPDNCGKCGNVCRGTCSGGRCDPALTDCIKTPQRESCDTFCASIGERCSENGCGGIVWAAWGVDVTNCESSTPIVECGPAHKDTLCFGAFTCSALLPAAGGAYECCCQPGG
jgi:hypothetical protein